MDVLLSPELSFPPPVLSSSDLLLNPVVLERGQFLPHPRPAATHPRRHSPTSRDTGEGHSWEGHATGIYWVGARRVSKHFLKYFFYILYDSSICG